MSWSPPTIKRLYEVVDSTWPAAEKMRCGPFVLRRGNDGGKRASAATLEKSDATTAEINEAAVAMQAIGQVSLFMVRTGDEALDQNLEELGYLIFDPVTLFACASEVVAKHDPKGLVAIRTNEPMAASAEIWAEGGITETRLDVMRRVRGAKTCFLGRTDDRPAGAAFVACDGDVAMIHALEVLQDARRKGLGLKITGAAGAWALEQGASTISLVVRTENEAACNLYRKLGMTEVGNYHYRIKE